MKHLASTVVVAVLTLSLATGQIPARKVTFNGKTLSEQEMQTIGALEQIAGVRLPDGAYWYDSRTGAMGFWNGPAAAMLPAGLVLGGAMPANCSGGLTAVFVNGRALHPLDVASLSRIVTVVPGRYWVDAQGYFGYEGGPVLGNLIALASRSGGGSQRRTFSNSELGVMINEAGACTSSGCIYR